MTIEAELIGGPRDGDRVQMPYLLPEYRVAESRNVELSLAQPTADDDIFFLEHVYYPRPNQTRQPIPYDYAGMRS